MEITTTLKNAFKPFDLVITIESEREKLLILQFFGAISQNYIAETANGISDAKITDYDGNDKEVAKFSDVYTVLNAL